MKQKNNKTIVAGILILLVLMLNTTTAQAYALEVDGEDIKLYFIESEASNIFYDPSGVINDIRYLTQNTRCDERSYASFALEIRAHLGAYLFPGSDYLPYSGGRSLLEAANPVDMDCDPSVSNWFAD